MLAGPAGDLITVIAQAIESDAVRGQIKAEVAARQQAIAPAEAWVPAISIADGWDLALGSAKHSNGSIWLFDTTERFGGAAEQAIKALVLGWDLPKVCGTQSGVIFICTEEQMGQIKAVAKASTLAEERARLEQEISETEAAIKSFGNPEGLRPKDELLAHQKAYNELVNEGGDGYLPPIHSAEGYQFLAGKLNQLKSKREDLG